MSQTYLRSYTLIALLLSAVDFHFAWKAFKKPGKVGRALGRWVRQLREMFNEFKEETGLSETIEDLKDTERDLSTTLREADPRMELKDATDEAQKALHEAKQDIRNGMPGQKKNN